MNCDQKVITFFMSSHIISFPKNRGMFSCQEDYIECMNYLSDKLQESIATLNTLLWINIISFGDKYVVNKHNSYLPSVTIYERITVS